MWWISVCRCLIVLVCLVCVYINRNTTDATVKSEFNFNLVFRFPLKRDINSCSFGITKSWSLWHLYTQHKYVEFDFIISNDIALSNLCNLLPSLFNTHSNKIHIDTSKPQSNICQQFIWFVRSVSNFSKLSKYRKDTEYLWKLKEKMTTQKHQNWS